MSGISEKLNNAVVAFSSKAGETGKLYGSITSQMIVDALNKKYNLAIERRMVELQPIRTLGEHKAHVRLTVDLTPEVRVIVHREGEVIAIEEAVEEVPAAEETEQQ